MNLDQALVDSYIDRAVEEFDANPLSTRIIRRFADESPGLFAAAAVRQLATTRQSNAHNFLNVLMLRQQHVLLDYITDPRQSEADRICLFQRAAAVDHTFEVKLARRLPARWSGDQEHPFEGDRAERALDVLDKASTGRRLLATLRHLVDSPDARTREKAILFVGKRMQSVAWVEKQLKKSDERARANAIESIWGLNSDSARLLLTICATDGSNRVEGNALVGLHLVGRTGVVEEVKRMADDPRPQFRSTAAWTMARIGGAAFAPRLIELAGDEQPGVRTAAMRSLMEIWLPEAKTAEAVVAKVSRMTALAPEETTQWLALAQEVMGTDQR